MPKPRRAAPLRIFLSYGHVSNGELVRRIKADLEQRAHDVWFDKIATRLLDYHELLLTLPEIRELDRKNPSDLFDYLLADQRRHLIDGVSVGTATMANGFTPTPVFGNN